MSGLIKRPIFPQLTLPNNPPQVGDTLTSTPLVVSWRADGVEFATQTLTPSRTLADAQVGKQISAVYTIGSAVGGSDKTAAVISTLEAEWNLDDLTDSSGNGHTLINNNSVAFVSGGLIGNCAQFDGSNYLSLADGLLDIMTPFTFAFWAKMTVSGVNVLLNKHDQDMSSDGKQFIVYVDGSGNVYFFGGSVNSLAFTWPNDTWNFICLRYDGSSAVKIRLNGGSDVPFSTGGIANGVSPLMFGNSPAANQFVPSGTLFDQMRCYHSELSDGEVDALYNGGAGV